MSEGRGIPLPGTNPPGISQRPMRQPLIMEHKKTDLQSDMQREIDVLEERNQSRYSSLLAATVILGLMIIAGIVVGFIIVGLQVHDTNNRVKNIQDEVNDVWSFLKKSNKEFNHDDDSYKYDFRKIQKLLEEVLWCTNKIKYQIVDVKNCTEHIKREVNDVKNCTTQIKEEVEEVKECTEHIKEEVEEVKECTDTIKSGVSNVTDSVNTLAKLPLSRILCHPQSNIDLPMETNVLISANLTDTEMFPTKSIGYNINSGEIKIRPPNIELHEQVIFHIQVRVLISEAGGSSSQEDGTYSLILSRSSDCVFGDCQDGIYSTTSRYLVDTATSGDALLWIELNTKINVDGSGATFYVFLRSNTGNGIINIDSNDASACATLWISLEALAPTFINP